MASTASRGSLAPYRVLDLTEGGHNLGPRLLGDLGADVVRIEPPNGSPTRRLGPFYKDDPSSERSLFWFAYNFNKRGITLNLESADGRWLFRSLVRHADFLFESFAPGYLESLGLGYPALQELNAGLIMASITPFGQTGPYARYQGPDLVLWALGGYLWMCGDPDRPPVRISLPPQVAFHASSMAAAASLMALYRRGRTGLGLYIDQSAHQVPSWMLTHTYQFYEYQGVVLKREGMWRQFGPTRMRTVFPCKDGFIVAMVSGGFVGAEPNRKLVAWMGQEGIAPDWLKVIDWRTYDARRAFQEEVDRITEAFGGFFRTKTKAELQEAAVRKQLLLAPVSTIADLLENPQLEARDYWVALPHEELGATMKYPGAPFVMSETPWHIYRPAPRLGEHNRDVYQGELSLSSGELEALKAAGVI